MIFEKLEKTNNSLFLNKPKVILGLSGGPDSIFLFEFLKKLHKEGKINLICTHLDHEWRKESGDDLLFCKNLCKKYNIKFIGKKASQLNKNIKYNGSKEEQARNLRHTLFKEVLKSEEADYIALAHHLNDQQETFIWRIIRGTTLSGLTCMKKVNKPYIRPLLDLEKKEILNYLDKNKIEYLKDYTNYSDNYLRNRIRKYVIPNLEKVDPRFNKKFASTLSFLQEEDEFLNQLTEKHFNLIFKKSENKQKLIGNLNEFKTLDKVLQKRILINLFSKQNLKFNLSNNYLNEILRFLNNPRGGSHNISDFFKINKKQNNFWVE
jgi:tRNA(Ile)-lysidine synthase